MRRSFSQIKKMQQHFHLGQSASTVAPLEFRGGDQHRQHGEDLRTERHRKTFKTRRWTVRSPSPLLVSSQADTLPRGTSTTESACSPSPWLQTCGTLFHFHVYYSMSSGGGIFTLHLHLHCSYVLSTITNLNIEKADQARGRLRLHCEASV